MKTQDTIISGVFLKSICCKCCYLFTITLSIIETPVDTGFLCHHDLNRNSNLSNIVFQSRAGNYYQI